MSAWWFQQPVETRALMLILGYASFCVLCVALVASIQFWPERLKARAIAALVALVVDAVKGKS